ncbi:hypothetical protein ACK2MR_18775 [Providencia hangzhouensis]|uniref:hypothetical protein n=1 Tax=Providencia TaxID=586 RepID=UPI0023492019|nr:hypothetical protein [Providencia sp. PROV221]
MSIISFENADNIASRFLYLLSKHNITPPHNSALESELLSLTQLLDIYRCPDLVNEYDNSEDVLRNAAGIYDLAAKVLAIETLPEFEMFLPHLRLISEKKIKIASIRQNSSGNIQDDTARKFAELYIGCLAIHFGTNIDIDSPTSSNGCNPDVMFTTQFENTDKPPITWALAIKTISTQNGQTIFERIKEATEQINHPRCNADKGLVIINVKDALDHHSLWNEKFQNEEDGCLSLKGKIENLIKKANENRPLDEWKEIFKGKAVCPILFMGQSLIKIPTITSENTPTIIRMFVEYNAEQSCDDEGITVANYLNHYMQSINLGIPGDSSHQPS